MGTAYSKGGALGSYRSRSASRPGDPLPDSVVLWTRLAPDALDPFGADAGDAG